MRILFFIAWALAASLLAACGSSPERPQIRHPSGCGRATMYGPRRLRFGGPRG